MPEKKSIFAWISDALYERVENSPEAAAPAAGETVERAPSAAATSPAPAQTVENPADLAARLREHISAQGRPFTQFLALVASFTEIIEEEPGRYRAALKALEKTGGLTAEQVLLAGKDQLQALESQREAFAEAVAAKRAALRQSGSGVDAIREKIAELQRSIGALQEQEQGILHSVAAEESRIKAAEQGFFSLLGSLHDEITATREKIKKHLA